MRQRRVLLVCKSCPRCGRMVFSLDGPIYVTQDTYNKYTGICKDCITPEEYHQMQMEIAKGESWDGALTMTAEHHYLMCAHCQDGVLSPQTWYVPHRYVTHWYCSNPECHLSDGVGLADEQLETEAYFVTREEYEAILGKRGQL